MVTTVADVMVETLKASGSTHYGIPGDPLTGSPTPCAGTAQ